MPKVPDAEAGRVKFCVKCERQIQWQATRCRMCGARQPAVKPPAPKTQPVDQLAPAPPPAARAETPATRGHVTQRQASVVILLLAGIFATLIITLFAPGVGTERWEYRVEAFSDYEWGLGASTLPGKLGEEGWEIVTARRVGDSHTMKYECILKRRKP